MEHREIRPKLSLAEFLSLRVEAMPRPSDIIKGTVMGPVVTPPESKETGIKFPGAAAARAKTAK